MVLGVSALVNWKVACRCWWFLPFLRVFCFAFCEVKNIGGWRGCYMVGRWGNWIKMLWKNSGREWEERCSSNFPRMEENGKTYFPRMGINMLRFHGKIIRGKSFLDCQKVSQEILMVWGVRSEMLPCLALDSCPNVWFIRCFNDVYLEKEQQWNLATQISWALVSKLIYQLVSLWMITYNVTTQLPSI